VFKDGFRKCHRHPQHRLPLGCELRELLVAASTDCFWCSLWHPKCDQGMHLALPPSHCKPVFSSIPIHNNPVGLHLETWVATSHPLPREMIIQETAYFTWRMRRSYVMLEIYMTLHYSLLFTLLHYSKFKGTSSKSLGNSSCRNQSYASPVIRPSKMKGPIS